MSTTRDVSDVHSAEQPSTSRRVALPIDGMSCAACAARVERALGKLDGVTEAAVNFAGENATVSFDASGPKSNSSWPPSNARDFAYPRKSFGSISAE